MELDSKAKARLLNKVLLTSFGIVVLLFAIYLVLNRQPPRKFLIPQGYCGWITVKYEKENATAVKKEDGFLVFEIPESGILETSIRLQPGWGKNVFYEKIGNSVEEIPLFTEEGGEQLTRIHGKTYADRKLDSILYVIPDGIDTTLMEGTDITREGQEVNVRTGRKLLQHFYLSCEPLPWFSQIDSLPQERKFW